MPDGKKIHVVVKKVGGSFTVLRRKMLNHYCTVNTKTTFFKTVQDNNKYLSNGFILGMMFDKL